MIFPEDNKETSPANHVYAEVKSHGRMIGVDAYKLGTDIPIDIWKTKVDFREDIIPIWGDINGGAWLGLGTTFHGVLIEALVANHITPAELTEYWIDLHINKGIPKRVELVGDPYDFDNFVQERTVQKLLAHLPIKSSNPIAITWRGDSLRNDYKYVGEDKWFEICKYGSRHSRDTIIDVKTLEDGFLKIERIIPAFPPELVIAK